MEQGLREIEQKNWESGLLILQKNVSDIERFVSDFEMIRYEFHMQYAQYQIEPDSIDITQTKALRKKLLQVKTKDHIAQSELRIKMNTFFKEYYQRIGLWGEALPYMYDNLAIQKTDSSIQHLQDQIHYSIGWTYHRMGQYDEAETSFRTCIEQLASYPDSLSIDLSARSLHFLGILAITQGDSTGWETYTRQAIEAFKTVNSENIIPPLLDLSNHYLNKQEFEESEALLEEAEDVIQFHEENPGRSHRYLKASVLSSKAGHYSVTGQKELGLSFAKQAFEAEDSPESQTQLLQQIAWLSADLGLYEQAFDKLAEHLEMYTAGVNSDQVHKMGDMRRQFELKQKEKEAIYMREQRRLQQKELEDQRTIIILILGGLGAMIFLSIYLFRLWKQIKRQAQELILARDAAEQGARVKAEFLSTMSHEIRTPMNGVIGMTDLLASTELDSEQTNYLRTISVSADSLLAIINDILDFSKIESGKMDLEQRPMSIRTCIEDVLDLFASKAAEKDLDLICFVDPSVPEGMLGDAVRIRQILSNLVSNAIKFTEEGEIFIKVSLAKSTQSVSDKPFELLIEVRDSGIGIPKDKISRLFQSFSQADASTTRKYGGTGLGLAISKKLCNIMGGDIWVESEAQKGSTFAFTIQTSRAEVLLSHSDTPNLHELSDKRILVVDDNETNREILDLQLRSWNMKVVLCESAQKGLEELGKDQSFDLILTDMHMPKMDGREFGEKIFEQYGKQSFPLVLLSSIGDELKHRAFFTEVMAKPVKQHQLQEILRKAINTVVVKENDSSIDLEEAHVLNQILGERYPMSILVAEDNKVNQKLISKMLSKFGYDIDIAENGKLAVEQVMNNTYDLVFMDVQMPEMDGLEASKNICEQLSLEERPLIISMTANVMAEDKAACEAAGMIDHLGKPFRSSQLKEILEKYAPKIKMKV